MMNTKEESDNSPLLFTNNENVFRTVRTQSEETDTV